MPRRRGRGQGSIEQLPSGSFRAQLTVRTIGGSKDRLSATFPTRTAAADWLAETRTKYRFGKLAVTTATLAEYLAEWLTRRTPTVAPGTAAFYAKQVGRLAGSALAPLALRKITRATIETALPALGTVDQQRKAFNTLRIVLNEAVEDGILPSSPARTARQPRANAHRLPFWTADDVGRILATAEGSYLAAYFWLGFDSGLRPGEMLGLHWPEVDFDGRCVRVVQALEDIGGDLRLKEPKTAKGRRTVRIGAESCKELRGHFLTMKAKGRDVVSGPVFVGQRTGALMTYNVFYQKYYRPVIKAAGVVGHSPYALRHTSATLLLAAGVGIKVVSERLGHEDVLTTLRHYAHVLPDAQEKAAKAMDGIMLGVKAPRPPHGTNGQADMSS